MANLDDLIEEGLNALESGSTLHTVVAGLKDEGPELQPILELASAMRIMEHPRPQLADSLDVHLGDLARGSRPRQPQRNIPGGRLALAGGVVGAAMLFLDS